MTLPLCEYLNTFASCPVYVLRGYCCWQNLKVQAYYTEIRYSANADVSEARHLSEYRISRSERLKAVRAIKILLLIIASFPKCNPPLTNPLIATADTDANNFTQNTVGWWHSVVASCPSEFSNEHKFSSRRGTVIRSRKRDLVALHTDSPETCNVGCVLCTFFCATCWTLPHCSCYFYFFFQGRISACQ